MRLNYMDLFRAARASGGPSNYVSNLIRWGRQEMLPVLAVAVAAAVFVTHVVTLALCCRED